MAAAKTKFKHTGNAGKGRRAGVPNKATAEIKALAQVYTAEALETLAQIMRKGQQEAARVAAANSLLDRGYGKPAQTIDATHRYEDDPSKLTEAELVSIARGSRGGAATKANGSTTPGRLH